LRRDGGGWLDLEHGAKLMNMGRFRTLYRRVFTFGQWGLFILHRIPKED
jgi:hypothetical protein